MCFENCQMCGFTYSRLLGSMTQRSNILDAGGQHSTKLPPGRIVEQAYWKADLNMRMYCMTLRIIVVKHELTVDFLGKPKFEDLNKTLK